MFLRWRIGLCVKRSRVAFFFFFFLLSHTYKVGVLAVKCSKLSHLVTLRTRCDNLLHCCARTPTLYVCTDIYSIHEVLIILVKSDKIPLEIHKLQIVHVPSIKEAKSVECSMFLLKLSSEGRCRSLEDSLDQRYGPRYIIESFPYITVE